MSGKKYVKIEVVARATMKELKRLEAKKPGSCITKEKLFPLIIKRIADDVGVDGDYMFFELEGEDITIPDEKHLHKIWSDITSHCARHHGFYIGWPDSPWHGLREVTIKEYQSNQRDIARIAQGVIDAINDRGDILKKKGEQSISCSFIQKLLTPGTEAQE